MSETSRLEPTAEDAGRREAADGSLLAALATVRAWLERHLGRDVADPGPVPFWPALDRLRRGFGLSDFECGTLLLCAAAELGRDVGLLCAEVCDQPSRPWPTPGLALAVVPRGHWSAVAPSGPLRQGRLLRVEPGQALVDAPLRIEERVLHHLAGVACLDERLDGFVAPIEACDPGVDDPLAGHVANVLVTGGSPSPVPVLCGPDVSAARAAAVGAAARLGLTPLSLDAGALPLEPREFEAVRRACEREAILLGALFVLELGDDEPEVPARRWAVDRLIERLTAPLVVVARQPRPGRVRPLALIDVPSADLATRRRHWVDTLGDAANDLDPGFVDALADQFRLNAPARSAAAASVSTEGPGTPADRLWTACRVQARPRLEGLAERIEPRAG